MSAFFEVEKTRAFWLKRFSSQRHEKTAVDNKRLRMKVNGRANQLQANTGSILDGSYLIHNDTTKKYTLKNRSAAADPVVQRKRFHDFDSPGCGDPTALR